MTYTARKEGRVMRLTIRTKLLIGFGVVLCFMLALEGVGWWRTTSLATELQRLDINHEEAGRLLKAESALWQLRYGVAQFMVVGDEARAQIVAEEPKWYQQVNAATHGYASGKRTPAEQQTLKEWEEALHKYVEARPRWFELYG